MSGVAKGHRYKDLTLFDLSDLALVGIGYNDLAEGVETPCRFWAHYTLSDKLNGSGNPYKDIAGLEPFAAPPPERGPAESPRGASGDTLTAILAACLRPITEELRAIRALLAVHVGAEPPESAGPGPRTGERSYTNGCAAAADNTAEVRAFDAFLEAEGRPPSSVAALRQWVLDTTMQAP